MKFSKRRQPVDFGAQPGLATTPLADVPPTAPDVRLRDPEPAPPLEPPMAAAPVAAQAPRTPATRPEFQPEPAYQPSTMDELDAPSGWPIWVAAVAVSV